MWKSMQCGGFVMWIVYWRALLDLTHRLLTPELSRSLLSLGFAPVAPEQPDRQGAYLLHFS